MLKKKPILMTLVTFKIDRSLPFQVWDIQALVISLSCFNAPKCNKTDFITRLTSAQRSITPQFLQCVHIHLDNLQLNDNANLPALPAEVEGSH